MKLSRNAVHERIETLAYALSTDLLLAEQLAQSKIEQTFAAAKPQPFGPVNVKTNQALRYSWYQAQISALQQCVPHVLSLGSYAAGAALRSVRQELFWCEQALPAKWAGVTDRVPQTVDPDLVDSVVHQWIAACNPLAGAYLVKQNRVITTARTAAAAVDGLFGTQGVWWHALPVAKDRARWVSITLCNQVRLDAMEKFNA